MKLVSIRWFLHAFFNLCFKKNIKLIGNQDQSSIETS